jgi:hypothetical protein
MKKTRSIRLMAASLALASGLSLAMAWPARADNTAPAASEVASNVGEHEAASETPALAAAVAAAQASPAWMLVITVVVGALFGSGGALAFNVREARN